MHTANLTRTDAVKLLLAKPVLRVRVSQRVHRYGRRISNGLAWFSRNRIEIALVSGIAFGSVFYVMAALTAAGK